MLILKEPFLSLWKGKDPFDEIEKIQGDVARALETMDIYRFLKIYFQAPLKEIFKKEKALFAVAGKKAARIKERTIRKGL